MLVNKATLQMVWAGEQGQALRLADYAAGQDADLTRRCTLFDLVRPLSLNAIICVGSMGFGGNTAACCSSMLCRQGLQAT